MKNGHFLLGNSRRIKVEPHFCNLVQRLSRGKKKKKKRFVPPGALCLSHTNTSVQVGPALRFTVETQKQEGVSHFVKEK